jgi:type IV pilus assembly protein PilO
MKLGIRELVFLLAIAGFSIVSVLYFRGQSQKLAAEEVEVAQKEVSLENLRKATAGIENLDAKIVELQKAIVFFESKLPQNHEVGKVLDEVSNVATANSLETRSFKPMPTEPNANYNEQRIEMLLSGDFNGFYSFLLQLEKLPRITRLMQMKLEKINDRDGEMTARVTLSIFFERDSATVANVN